MANNRESMIAISKETLLYVIDGQAKFSFEDVRNGKGNREIPFVVELSEIVNKKKVKVTEVTLALDVYEVTRKPGEIGYGFKGICSQVEGKFRGYYNPKTHKGWIVRIIENDRLN